MSGGELGAGCAVEPALWKTDTEFFPPCHGLKLLCSFPGADKSPEKVLLAGLPKEQLVLERWVSVGFGSRGQGCFCVESSLSHGR